MRALSPIRKIRDRFALADVLARGGGGGIRTHVTVSRKHAFQACAFSHSATPPYRLARRRTRTLGTSTCAEGGLFSRRCAIGPVRWGGTIVAAIGLTRHCDNRR